MKGKSTEVKYTDSGLRDIERSLRKKLPTIKIGVLGSSNQREGTKTNAEVGAYHEFGTTKMPQRSFLRMPISEKLQSALKKAGAFDESVLRKIRTEKDLISFAKKLGQTGENVVLGAFDSGGYGNWPSTKTQNNTGNILVDTKDLRESITHEVKK